MREPTVPAEASRQAAECRAGVYDSDDCDCVVVCWGHGDQRHNPEEHDHDEP